MVLPTSSSRVGEKWAREDNSVFASDLSRIKVNVLKANN